MGFALRVFVRAARVQGKAKSSVQLIKKMTRRFPFDGIAGKMNGHFVFALRDLQFFAHKKVSALQNLIQAAGAFTSESSLNTLRTLNGAPTGSLELSGRLALASSTSNSGRAIL